MTARIALIAQYPHTSRFLSAELQKLVGKAASVIEYCYERGLDRVEADVAVVSTPKVTSWLGPWLSPHLRLITLNRTLTKSAWEKVMCLPPRTQVLVVNDIEETAVETVALLHELGATHLKLVPYWPGAGEVPPVALAITPSEVHLVPRWVESVIDLGPRVIEPSTVVDLLTMMDLYDGEAHTRLLAYSETVMPKPSLRHSLNWFTNAKAQLEAVLDEVQEGVISYDAKGIITLVNRRAEVLVGRETWKLVGQKLESVVREVGLDHSVLQRARKGPQVVDLGSRQVVVRLRSLGEQGGQWGSMLVLRDVTEIQELERRLRRDLKARGHITRYSFTNIIGNSPMLRATVQRGEKLVAGNGTILIHGESGTGKELFAQAIHAASPRARYPFVAVNCAAVPETLLESELFGYEEGAFTGARRGGKEGLFEQAHMGTIFLDEIGDLSPTLQGRLLRALQEKEILRVGATRVRPVDVRVMSATHKDLTELVRQGQFRADLFHRLNVLTLRVPPLRERKEDIPELLRRFLIEMNCHHPIPEDVMSSLMHYDWPGNVREVRNCVEHMVQVADGPFTLNDLPVTFITDRTGYTRTQSEVVVEVPEGRAKESAPVRDLADRELRFLLGALAPSPLSPRMGRRALVKQAMAVGLLLTEAQIRHRLGKLADMGLVSIRQSASPSLTQAGVAVLHQLAVEKPIATG